MFGLIASFSALSAVLFPQPEHHTSPVLQPRALGTSANATWHSLSFSFPSPNQHFTSLSGVLTVPTSKVTSNKSNPEGTSVYLWPGLQPSDAAGVLQNVLDYRPSGRWKIASGWCCHNPELPWGDDIWPSPGQQVRFRNELNGKNWTMGLQIVGVAETGWQFETFEVGKEAHPRV